MKKLLLTLLVLINIFCLATNADQYTPEFTNMKLVKCEISETVYNQDNSIVSKNNYFRIFRFDDEYKKLYLQKEPIDRISDYSDINIQYQEQSMTDDFIMYSSIKIDRVANQYFAESQITYDNPEFPARFAKAQGDCKILN